MPNLQKTGSQSVISSPAKSNLFMRFFMGMGRCFKFYFDSFNRAFLNAWLGALAVSGGVGLLIPLVLYLFGIGLTFSQEAAVNHLYVQIPLLIFIVFFAIMLFYVPFSKYERLRAENEGLQEQLRPQLDISFYEDRAGFIDTVPVVWGSESKMCKLYRVAVTHPKSASAELEAERVTTSTPTPRAYPPLHLRITGKHAERERQLRPGTPAFWDVIEKPISERGWVKLMHIENERDILLPIPSGVRITASCDEGFPVTKLLTWKLKTNNDLDFQLTDI